MQNEKLQIVMGQGVQKAEVILRELKEANELPVVAPVRIDITGNPGTIAEFLKRRLDQEDQINQKRCHIIVDREKLKMVLTTNENDHYLSGKVSEVIALHPKIIEFGINMDFEWEPNELGMFFKMNRAYFVDKSENMSLVTKLMNFKANINSTIEKNKGQSGDFADNFSGAVTSNVPGSFKLQIPIFKGMPKEELEVEFWATINGRNASLKLISPGTVTALEDVRDRIFNEQIKAIRDIAPDIAIIEK